MGTAENVTARISMSLRMSTEWSITKKLATKYNISSESVIIQWIKRYNNHIEQRDDDPRWEVYMAERKKTTKEERMEIVQYLSLIHI